MSEGKERTFIIGIFGDNFEQKKLLAQSLGAPDIKSDIQIYERIDFNLGYIFTAMIQLEYPDKIKPFLQILRMAKIHVLVIDLEKELNAIIGEILVGMDLSHQLTKTKTLITVSGINSKTEWKLAKMKKEINNILKNTSIKDTEILELKNKNDYNAFKEKIIELGLSLYESDSKNQAYLKVLIDHAFPVKGIGTVILGIIEEGSIKAGQMVEIIGYEDVPRKVIVRNIQKYDRNFKEANKGDRVGLALKGNIAPNEISRDNIIVNQGIFKNEKEIKANVYVYPFYKPKGGTIKPGDGTQFHCIVELKVSPIKFIEGEELIPGEKCKVKIKFDKSLIHDGSGLKGIIMEMTKFENKLRFIGWFKQTFS
ncbi:MAG: EF-Tu/IF-2/RF-3 family GTPase [Promethearchaeota archaeon]